jgi:hypothetical protein
MQQIEIAGGQAKVAETQASAKLKEAQAIKALADVNTPPTAPEAPNPVENMKAVADIDATQAKADHSRAQAFKTMQEARLAPFQMAQEASDRAADREMRAKTPVS